MSLKPRLCVLASAVLITVWAEASQSRKPPRGQLRPRVVRRLPPRPGSFGCDRSSFATRRSAINNQITAMNRQAREQAQASQDRISRRFSEYIRGAETYTNPITNQPVQLPAGYGRAWTNHLGEYIVSDSPSYNPNIGSSTNWHPMPRVP